MHPGMGKASVMHHGTGMLEGLQPCFSPAHAPVRPRLPDAELEMIAQVGVDGALGHPDEAQAPPCILFLYVCMAQKRDSACVRA